MRRLTSITSSIKIIVFIRVAYSEKKNLFEIFLDCFSLENKDPLELYPALRQVQKKKGNNFSIICTTKRMRYYSRNFNWFKENGILPNTTHVIRHSTFLRLDIMNLKVEDTGTYKCNVTDDPGVYYKSFQLIVIGAYI